MYGTRDAAQNWEHASMEFMESGGFRNGVATPCVFHDPSRDLRAVVQRDDFTVLGPNKELDWLCRTIANRFDVNFRRRLGPEATDDRSIRLLNHVSEGTEDGISLTKGMLR